MKTYLKKSLLVIATAIAVAGCGAEISGSLDKDGDPGTADFTTFVAIGDSLTAGYADSALYPHGQENSYPAILAQQFMLAGGGAFTQPLMPVGATGKMSLTGSAEIGNLTSDRLMLTATGDPDSPASPAPISPTQTTSIDARVGNGGFNNLGVPGAKVYHVPFPGYGALSAPVIDAGGANPFYARFSSNDGTSMLVDALALAPTFFVFWVGNNDLLLYAADGGLGIDQTGNSDVSTYGPENDITDPGFFENGFPGLGLPSYAGMVAALTAGGAKGVLINLPDVSTIPYFTTVPYNAIPLDADQASDANAGFATYNGFLQSIVAPSASPCPIRISQEEADRRQISFSEGANPIVILDENLTDLTPCNPALLAMRQATANDLILLPTASKLGEDASPPYLPGSLWGISGPLLDADVLIDTEIAAVKAAQLSINAIIKATADANPDLLFFDAEAKLRELNDTGISYGSGGISSTFAQGGAFSLDGVHPTARGYAVIANEIFKVINAGFDAYIPPVDPSEYTTVFYQ